MLDSRQCGICHYMNYSTHLLQWATDNVAPASCLAAHVESEDKINETGNGEKTHLFCPILLHWTTLSQTRGLQYQKQYSYPGSEVYIMGIY